MMNRMLLFSLLTVAVLPAKSADWSSNFQYCLLEVGQHWDDRSRALIKLSFEVQKRCNIPVESKFITAKLDDVAKVNSPFLIISGKGSFKEPTSSQARNLRTILRGGGVLLFDDMSDKDDKAFYQSAVKFMKRVLPDLPGPHVVPRDHAIYQSYYLLKEPRGRTNRAAYLEGWSIGKRTPVLFSHNDLLGAFEADKLGSWKHSMEIGGGMRRELCFRLGINLTYYTLTLNYKKDRAFPPIIERRRRQ